MFAIQRCVLVFLLLVLCCVVVQGRGIWGSRRKREDQVEEESVSATGGFESRRRQAAAAAAFDSRGDNRRQAAAVSTDSNGGSGSGFGSRKFGDEMRVLIETYLNLMEEAISSPEFSNTVTPTVIREMLDKVPMLAENPQIAAMIDSPEFSDPEKLMATIKTGVASLRQYTDEIVALLNSPEQMSALVDQLPVEVRGAVQGLMRGDKSGVMELLDNLPGITPAQRGMARSLLSGNVKGLESSMKSIMGDRDQVEAARQQLLAHPEMLEALGLDADVLNDKKKFAELMESGIEAFSSLGEGDGEGEEEQASDERVFAGSRAA